MIFIKKKKKKTGDRIEVVNNFANNLLAKLW